MTADPQLNMASDHILGYFLKSGLGCPLNLTYLVAVDAYGAYVGGTHGNQ